MVTKTYKCAHCKHIETTEGMNADIPRHCDNLMQRDYSTISMNVSKGTRAEWKKAEAVNEI